MQEEDKGKDKEKKKLIAQLAVMPAWALALLLCSISLLAAPIIYLLIVSYRKRKATKEDKAEEKEKEKE